MSIRVLAGCNPGSFCQEARYMILSFGRSCESTKPTG
jgi:hypothetical protein